MSHGLRRVLVRRHSCARRWRGRKSVGRTGEATRASRMKAAHRPSHLSPRGRPRGSALFAGDDVGARGERPCSTSSGYATTRRRSTPGLRKRGLEPGGEVKFAAELIALDEARRKVVTRLQEAQARRNAASKEIGKAKGGQGRGQGGRADGRGGGAQGRRWRRARKSKREADKALHEALSVIPNLPRDGRAGRQGREGQQGGAPGR